MYARCLISTFTWHGVKKLHVYMYVHIGGISQQHIYVCV